VFGPAELAQIAELCCAHDLLAVTDEVYEHLVFDGTHVPLATLPGMAERTVSISSGGKTFSFTGWKVGWVSGPAPLVAAVRAAKQFLTYTSGAPFQLAIARAWPLAPDVINQLGPELKAKRDLFCDGLASSASPCTARRPPTSPPPTSPRWPPACSAHDFCRALPATLRRGGHPELGVLRPRRSGRRGGPWSAGPSASASRFWKRRWPDSPVSIVGPRPCH
jgi:N-succinyldiaminopimelate aminotransferase